MYPRKQYELLALLQAAAPDGRTIEEISIDLYGEFRQGFDSRVAALVGALRRKGHRIEYVKRQFGGVARGRYVLHLEKTERKNEQ